MRNFIVPVSTLLLLSACAIETSTKPVEFLDERTAITVGALKEPIELVPTATVSAASRLLGRHVTFAYLGPVEWDRAGELEYGLWVHIAPGTGQPPLADLGGDGALTLNMDSGPLVLTPIDAPQLGRSAYAPVAAWGQTAYFALTVPTLKAMSESEHLSLEVLGQDGQKITFNSSADARSALKGFIHDRQITGD